MKELWRNYKIIILIVGAFIAVIVLIAVMSWALQGEGEIVNEESVADISSLSTTDWKRVRETTGIDDLEIRSGTYKEEGEGEEKKVVFIADSDAKKVSVEINFYPEMDDSETPITVNCVEQSLSKYPDSLCDGFNGASTIDNTFGDDLPFYIQLGDGRTIVVAKGYDGANSYLNLEGQFCESEELKEEAISKTKELIAENYDLNAEMFTYKTNDFCSSLGE